MLFFFRKGIRFIIERTMEYKHLKQCCLAFVYTLEQQHAYTSMRETEIPQKFVRSFPLSSGYMLVMFEFSKNTPLSNDTVWRLCHVCYFAEILSKFGRSFPLASGCIRLLLQVLYCARDEIPHKFGRSFPL